MWTPRDLSEVCSQQHIELNSCSSFGYFYLSLLAHLFGDSVDKQKLHNYDFYEGAGSQYSEFIYQLERNNGTERLNDNNNNVNNNLDGSKDNNKRRKRVTGVNVKEKSNKSERETTRASANTSRGKRGTEGEEYDFIIVGAGSAGCVLANRLTEVKHWKVLLIEAGDEEPEVADTPAFTWALYGSSVDWGYSTMPDGRTCSASPNGRCSWPRGKVMGGSSVINSMIYLRGNKADYDEWAEAGNYGWSYNEVLPYFKKSENNHDSEAEDRKHHAVGGNLNVQRFPYTDGATIIIVEALQELGLPLTDLNAENQIGTMISQTTSKDGIRDSTNTAYIRSIRHVRDNLFIKTNSEVIQILIDPDTKIAYGVKYIKDGFLNTAYSKKEVILSGGAINTPKLLMLSGVGPHEHLKDLDIEVIMDLPVGRNLQDHVTMDGLPIIMPNNSAMPISKEAIIEEIYKYDHVKDRGYYDGPLSSTGANTAIGLYSTEYSLYPKDVPDVQLHFNNLDIREYLEDTTQYLSSRTTPVSYYDSISPRPELLKPESRGYILLNSSNPYGPPLLFANYLKTPRDLATMISAMKFSIQLESTPSFKSAGAYYWREPLAACRGLVWGTDEYLECILRAYTSTSFHPTCTCKMGPNWDRDAVVDPRLRVYGVGHLRVVDASIMPTITRSNTNAPTIMIAEKGADMIKADWDAVAVQPWQI